MTSPLLSLVELASRAYGQARGYHRWTIAAEVDAAMRLAPAELRARQQAAFRRHAWECIQRFPAYARKVLAHCGRLPAGPEDALLDPAALPVWTRADQREHFSQWPLENKAPGWIKHSTGGSTGVPTHLYMTRASYEWRTAVTRRGYGWGHAEPGRRVFYIWSDAATPPPRLKRAKLALHQWLERRKYFNCFFFSLERQAECCAAINRCRPETVVGYAGKLVELACFVRDHPGALSWRPQYLVPAAEGLRPGQRELLERHLGGTVFLSYGSREFMLIGMECAEHRGYHLSDDNLYVEVADAQGRPLPPGQSGRILVTDLHNEANPFVRYEIGDLGVLAPETETCPCGLPFRRLLRVDGRLQEGVITPDGARLTAIFFAHVLKEFPWIDAFQVWQCRQEGIELRLVAAAPLDPGQVRAVTDLLQTRMGRECQIDIKQVPQLQQLPNGKTPSVISEIHH